MVREVRDRRERVTYASHQMSVFEIRLRERTC
jgi:hypothetical protein